MSTEPQFHPDRSAALRRMLVDLPSAQSRPEPHRAHRSVPRRALPYVLGAAIATGIAVVAVSSSVPVSEEASDIVPAMTEQQTGTDMLPGAVADQITGTGADPDSTRFVGSYQQLDYYAAAAAENKDICLIAVGPVELEHNAGWSMGCTKAQAIEGTGLQLEAQNGSITAWLWDPQVPLTEEQKDEWTVISPHLLIRTD